MSSICFAPLNDVQGKFPKIPLEKPDDSSDDSSTDSDSDDDDSADQ